MYLLACIGCFVFHISYGEWFAWVLMLTVFLLPWLSLLLSLPAIFMTKVKLDCPTRAVMGTKLKVQLLIRSPFPMVPIQWKFSAHEHFTGKKLIFLGNSQLLADHCGKIDIRVLRVCRYDYMGLFRFPIRKKETAQILVQPKPVLVRDIPSLKKYIAGSWHPKPGGGFAENYDLRLYRPGDDLRQIHWKLSSKTAKLVLREPIIPIRGKLILSMLLRGNAQILDEKLGRLLYLSQYLLKKELIHEVYCLTGEGILHFAVEDPASLAAGLDKLLAASLTEQNNMQSPDAAWHYRIGGELDES